MRIRSPPERNQSTPLKAACPSDHPSLCSRPLKRSLTSFGSTAATSVQKKGNATPCGFFSGLEHPFCLVVAHFKENVRRPFCVCLFVRSSTCLTVRTKRIVELMNVSCCYYLLACACMDLLFLCFFFFRGGRTGRIPGLKKEKKKIRSILYTM